MSKWREFWSGKKKIIGTLLAAAVQIYGMKNGWDAEVRNAASLMFMTGVTMEGIIDVASMFKRGT